MDQCEVRTLTPVSTDFEGHEVAHQTAANMPRLRTEIDRCEAR